MSAFLASYPTDAASSGESAIGAAAAADGDTLSERATHQLTVLNQLFETAVQNAKLEAIETAAEAAAKSGTDAATNPGADR